MSRRSKVRPRCPQRVVFVEGGEAEDGHDRVADELLHAAAVVFDCRLHRVEVAGDDASYGLRVEPLPEAGGADEVGEDDRDRLAHLAAHRCSVRRSTRLVERG
jgi:hypothetical protein